MSNIDVRTTVSRVEVTGGGYNTVDVEIENLDTDDVLKEMDISEVVETMGADELLDSIGEEAARKYWGIKDDESPGE